VLPKPPALLQEADVSVLPQGSTLHRVHLSQFGCSEFNPCRGGNTRFAPIADSAGQCVPSLYAGATAAAAFHETIFHDIPATAGIKTVPLQDVTQRTHSLIETLSDLTLVELRNVPLNRWGISRRDLIESNPAHYKQTAAWAQTIHQCFPDVHGLVWTYRQCDPDDAYLFFGDRVQSAGFTLIESRSGTDVSLVADIRKEGRRRGITIVV